MGVFPSEDTFRKKKKQFEEHLLDHVQMCDQGKDRFSYLSIRWNYREEPSCFIECLPWLSSRTSDNGLRYTIIPQTTQIVETILYDL